MEIWKFPLGDGMEQDIPMPQDAEILTVQVQRGHACLWAKVNPAAKVAERRIYIVGTGHEMPGSAVHYIGTIQQGPFVWHVYE